MWLLINAKCQLSESAALSVGDRWALIRAVVKAHKAASGQVELTAEDFMGGGFLGTAQIQGG